MSYEQQNIQTTCLILLVIFSRELTIEYRNFIRNNSEFSHVKRISLSSLTKFLKV
jgi:hypothetical protein